MIVVDASVVLTALIDDDIAGRQVRDRMRNESLAAPALVDLEVVSAMRRRVRRDQLAVERAEQAMVDLSRLRVRRFDHRRLIPRCWDLRDNLTPYDAAYVALAENLGVILLTADERMSGAPGVRCAVEVLR